MAQLAAFLNLQGPLDGSGLDDIKSLTFYPYAGKRTSNARFDAVYCRPHAEEDNCTCKKSKTGMIDTAKRDFDIDINNSYVIGDMGNSDMPPAKNIDLKSILDNRRRQERF